MEGLAVNITFDDNLFTRIKFYKDWSIKSKNQKTKAKLVKKAIKEMKSINYESIKKYCTFEMVKGC